MQADILSTNTHILYRIRRRLSPLAGLGVPQMPSLVQWRMHAATESQRLAHALPPQPDARDFFSSRFSRNLSSRYWVILRTRSLAFLAS